MSAHIDPMSTSIEPSTGDLRDNAQGAFFVLETVTDLESYGGPYSNTGAPKEVWKA